MATNTTKIKEGHDCAYDKRGIYPSSSMKQSVLRIGKNKVIMTTVKLSQ